MVTLHLMDPREAVELHGELLAREYGPLDDVDFVVIWPKFRDDEANGARWDGWPVRGDRGMHRVDDPDNWKTTLFVFTHA